MDSGIMACLTLGSRSLSFNDASLTCHNRLHAGTAG